MFNEARTVASVIDKVRALDLEKEIIIVDDGSSDGTREALVPYEKGIAGIRVHKNPVNLGKGASVRIGFSIATGDIVTIQDADLEVDPGEYVKLIEPILEGRADVVYGSRFLEGGKKGSTTFYLANRGLAVLTNLLYGSRITDMETCYKIFRRDVLDNLKLRAARFEIEPEITAQVLKRGYRIVELPIAYNSRTKAEGRKIRWQDGFSAVYMLVCQRISDG